MCSATALNTFGRTRRMLRARVAVSAAGGVGQAWLVRVVPIGYDELMKAPGSEIIEFPRIVLIIDGHRGARRVLSLALQHYGFMPVTAPSGTEGIAYLQRGLMPCAILLDPVMPGDGWQFRAEQMENPLWAKIPVIVGTAMRERPELIAPQLEIPSDHCLVKPFDFEKLLT